MKTHLVKDSYSESHTAAQLSTFRNTGNVRIDGGTFSMTNTTAEQRTHMDSGKLHLHSDVRLPPWGLTLIVCSKVGNLRHTMAILIAHQDTVTKGGPIQEVHTQGILAETEMILNRH